MNNTPITQSYPANTLGWISGALQLFISNPKMWLFSGVIMLLALAVAMVFSWFGQLALSLLSPVLIGSLMLGAAKQQRGDEFNAADLGAAFKDSGLFKRLALLGCFLLVLNLALTLLTFGVVMIFGGGETPGSILQSISEERSVDAMRVIGPFAIMSILSLIVYAMAMMFSIPHIVFRHAEPFTAILVSLTGSLRYFSTVIGCGVVFFLVSVLVFAFLSMSIALALTVVVIVLWPISVCLQYVAYMSVFQKPDETDSDLPHDDASFNA